MKKILMEFTLALLALLLILQPVLAGMSSPAYQMDWLLPLTGSGGPQMTSTNYMMDATLGQTVTGEEGSTFYSFHSGYWAFLGVPYTLFLPAIQR